MQRRQSQQSNLDASTIRLDEEDRAAIAGLPKDRRFAPAAMITIESETVSARIKGE
ncbi:hypothetical protein AB4Z46_12735 [Variovorax sp. M-6]|uniref:hypothetical protein n=1 Tax=Variovorax sp. M-6 TaxID=3233041 RepID=UPI003F998833